MTKALTSFVLVAALTALSTALCLAVAKHGYPFGMTGARRIEAMADAGAFLPLAAVYCLSALLMMVLPLRAASFVLLNAADTLFCWLLDEPTSWLTCVMPTLPLIEPLIEASRSA